MDTCLPAKNSRCAEQAFVVVEQELTFLDEYYQAIIPLALPKPELFFANFAFSLLFLLIYVIAIMLVTGNGNIFHVLVSLFRGLVDLSTDMVLQYRCFVHQASFFLTMVLSSSDLIVTFLLTFTFLAIETYEFPALRRLARVQRTIKAALWFRVRSHRIKVHQLTLLRLCQVHPRQVWLLLSRLLKRRLVGLKDAVVTAEAKEAIVKVLNDVLDRIASKREEANDNGNDVDEGSCFSNGRDALRRSTFSHLEWACDERGGGAATVILVWHLATTLLETRDDRRKHPLSPAGRAAVTLSRYCAYLVAYEPGLLSDDRVWTEKAYNKITAELDGFFGSCCTTAHRRDRLMTTGFHRGGDVLSRESTALEKGVRLAKELDRAAGNATAPNVRHSEAVWGMLLELWAELLVFAARAPSGKAETHALALANGGEFITHIWAILIHAGVRPRRPSHHHHDPEYEDIPIL
ncbi:hypothetical protein EJB05_06215, partial [Eragrostis curvula]